MYRHVYNNIEKWKLLPSISELDCGLYYILAFSFEVSLTFDQLFFCLYDSLLSEDTNIKYSDSSISYILQWRVDLFSVRICNVINSTDSLEVIQLLKNVRAQNMFKKRIYSIKELVKEIGATEWFWRTQIWDGQLPYIQVGKKMFIDGEDVELFLQKHKCVN